MQLHHPRIFFVFIDRFFGRCLYDILSKKTSPCLCRHTGATQEGWLRPLLVLACIFSY